MIDRARPLDSAHLPDPGDDPDEFVVLKDQTPMKVFAVADDQRLDPGLVALLLNKDPVAP